MNRKLYRTIHQVARSERKNLTFAWILIANVPYALAIGNLTFAFLLMVVSGKKKKKTLGSSERYWMWQKERKILGSICVCLGKCQWRLFQVHTISVTWIVESHVFILIIKLERLECEKAFNPWISRTILVWLIEVASILWVCPLHIEGRLCDKARSDV